MASFVVLAFDAFEAGLAQARGQVGERFAAGIGGGQPGQDSFQHPGSAQVQSGQVIELAVGRINDPRRFQFDGREEKRGTRLETRRRAGRGASRRPRPGRAKGNLRPKVRSSAGSSIRHVVIARRDSSRVSNSRFAGDARVIQHQAQAERGVVVFAGADGVR